MAAAAASASAVFLSFMIHSPWLGLNVYSDIASFWIRTPVQQGLVPYFQYFFEYPPLSGYLLYFARIVGGDYDGYYTVFGLMSLAAAVGIGWSCWRVTALLGRRLDPVYFFLPSIIVYGVYNFDLFNALFIILSLQFLLEGRKDVSALWLGLSVVLKLVGGLLLPVYLLELRKTKDMTRYVLIVAAVVAFFYLPIAVLNPKDLYQFYTYFRDWGLEDAWYLWIFLDPFSAYAKLFGFAVTVLLLARAYTLKVPLVHKVFLTLAAYLLGAYIYAPQFNVMLIPLVTVLVVEKPSLYLWEVFNAFIILTWFLVPNPTSAGTLPQAMALLRTGCLAWLCLDLVHAAGLKTHDLLPARLRSSLADFRNG